MIMSDNDETPQRPRLSTRRAIILNKRRVKAGK